VENTEHLPDFSFGFACLRNWKRLGRLVLGLYVLASVGQACVGLEERRLLCVPTANCPLGVKQNQCSIVLAYFEDKDITNLDCRCYLIGRVTIKTRAIFLKVHDQNQGNVSKSPHPSG